MSATHAPAGGQVPVETKLEWLVRMHEIRFFEEECQRLFTDGSVRGSTHLCQGQEATAMGGCAALEPGDTMTCTYRGHGAVLAKGAPLDRTFGEIMGKANGLCGGKGGSMHLTDVSVGAYGSFAIIGAHLPIAVGLALGERYSGSDRVSLCYFGDGATNIGAFHEALNMAQVFKLPVVFFCENNLYGEYSPLANTTPITDLADRADAYNMAKAIIDGNDVDTVYEATLEAVRRGRAGEGPTLIEAKTYRHKGHSRTDPAKYRPEGELERWLERDPILLLERKLLEAGIEQDRLDAEKAGAEERVVAALDTAKSWPDPDLSTRFDHVYA
jgi:acetoin:2,6-dichlorophenolindophenol oxidoreductase subunit alpha